MSAANAFVRLFVSLVKNPTVGKGIEGIFQVTEPVVMLKKTINSREH